MKVKCASFIDRNLGEHGKPWGGSYAAIADNSPSTLSVYRATRVPTGEFVLQFIIQDSGSGL